MYRGVQFRSRLEAKYACLFDQLGWVWDYEQLDYDGYIPDFTLAFKKPMLVEVKPINDWFGFDWNPVIEKAIDSGVKGRLMVVGAKVFHFESLGATTIGRIYEQELFPDDAYCVPTVVHLCDHCGKFNPTSTCEYDGSRKASELSYEQLNTMWKHASNTVQWKGPK